ncbi:MAG: dienelactone hydrolase family protein [Ilumatobacteraceae bacterium]
MLKTESVSYDVDGVSMVGHLAVDDGFVDGGELRPGVLLSHEGSGLDENVRSRAERLAALGYVAFALDYFGGGRQLPLAEAQIIVRRLIDDPDAMRRLAHAGLEVLTAQPLVDPGRIAAIGFCLGGSMSLELARSGAPLRVVVGFHPGLGSPRPEDSANITGSVLMCCGADDPIIPVEARQKFEEEMRSAGVADWRMEVYGGVGHSFTNPAIDARGFPGFAYNEQADRRSWRSMLDLLRERLDPPVS